MVDIPGCDRDSPRRAPGCAPRKSLNSSKRSNRANDLGASPGQSGRLGGGGSSRSRRPARRSARPGTTGSGGSRPIRPQHRPQGRHRPKQPGGHRGPQRAASSRHTTADRQVRHRGSRRTTSRSTTPLVIWSIGMPNRRWRPTGSGLPAPRAGCQRAWWPPRSHEHQRSRTGNVDVFSASRSTQRRSLKLMMSTTPPLGDLPTADRSLAAQHVAGVTSDQAVQSPSSVSCPAPPPTSGRW